MLNILLPLPTRINHPDPGRQKQTERNDIVRFSKVTTNSLASGIVSEESNELGESKIAGEL